MQPTFLNRRNYGAEQAALIRPNGEPPLNVALVFQDDATRQWAGQAWEQAAEMLGEGSLRCTEWRISDLRKPGSFSEGAAALAKADLIVVSVHAAERLPAVFYLWVNLWLQQRSGLPGTLAALVLPAEASDPAANETRRYFCAVASQARLVLLESGEPGKPMDGFREAVSQSPQTAAPASSRGWLGEHRFAA